MTDFGRLSDTTQPWPITFGIPSSYRAPEIILDKSATLSLDLWSLTLTLFEIRAREQFITFETPKRFQDDQCIGELITSWESRRMFGENLGRVRIGSLGRGVPF
jgi:serine/threonine protein kinase